MQEMFLRKIPEDMRPWECNVNGVKYVYPAGTEQNVPAEVAALIDAYWEKQEVDYPETGISFNDLRDRPFGEDMEVLFDQRVEYQTAIDSGSYTMEGALPIYDGDSVTVTWDGVRYDFIAVTMDVEGVHAVVFGRTEEGNDTPFLVCIVNGYPLTIINAYDTLKAVEERTVKIEKSVIHTIDPKFLPGGGGGKVILYTDWPYLNKSADLGESTRPSKAEVFEYAKNGGFVIAEPDGGTYYFPVVISTGGENMEYANVDCYDSWFYSKEYVHNDAPSD